MARAGGHPPDIAATTTCTRGLPGDWVAAAGWFSDPGSEPGTGSTQPESCTGSGQHDSSLAEPNTTDSAGK